MRKTGRLGLLLVLFSLLTLFVPQNQTTRAQGQSALATLAASMPPGTWAKLTTTVIPTDITTLSGSDGILPYSMAMVWDSTHHFGYYYGGAHLQDDHPECFNTNPEFNEALCSEAGARMLKYTESTSTWDYQKDLIRNLFSAGYTTGHTDESTSLDPATGDVYRHSNYGSGVLSRFDYINKTWTSLAGSSGVSDLNINGTGWFPEANGLVMYVGAPGNAVFYNPRTNAWSTAITGMTGKTSLGVALYNPHQHNMLLGGGHFNYGDCTKFWILSYSGGTFSLSPQHTVPNISTYWNQIGPGQLCFDIDTQTGHIAVDPVTGHYIVLVTAPDGTTDLTYDVNIPDPTNPSLDTWTLLTGANAWPSTFKILAHSGGAGYIGSTAVPEYGVTMFLVESTSGDVQTWLYKHAGSSGSVDTTSPSVPTGLFAMATSSSQINLSWNASTDNVGIAGYNVYRNSSQIGTSFGTNYQDTSLSPSTTYTYAIAAYDAGGNTSSRSASASGTTQSPVSDTTPPVISSIASSSIGSSSATISWTTNEAADTQVDYGLTTAYGSSSTLNTSITTSHMVTLTGLSSATTYNFRVKSRDAAGNLAISANNSFATSTSGTLTFQQKCAMAGVLICDDFDDASKLRYYWGTIDHGDSESQWGHICDSALGGTHTNYPYDFTASTFANTTATIGPGSTCNYPIIDTTIKSEGAGSIKFPIPSNGYQAVGGEFSEPFKKYMDGTFGYIGPDAGMATTKGAHHEGDEMWMQFRMRNDSVYLSTKFTQRAFEGGFTTSGAGATTVTIDHDTCFYGGPPYGYAIQDTYPSYWPNYPSLSPQYIPMDTVGRTMRFVWGTNFLTDRNFTIVSLVNDGPTSTTHCSVVLDSSPTPNGQGGISPAMGYGPVRGYGFISSPNQTDGQKGMGVFGDSSTQSHTDPAAQVFLDFRQMGLPGVYAYGQGGGIFGMAGQPIRGCNDPYPETFEASAIYLTEPTCIRFHPNVWQEHTIHIKLIAPGPHNIYESWIDGVKVQETNVYDVEFQDTYFANGMGAFNFSPYNTAKDPNQTYTDTAVWLDDLIVSTQPIAMATGSLPTVGDVTLPTVTLRIAPKN